LSGQILQNRLYFRDRYSSITPELIVKGAWVSTALALIMAIPGLLTFVGIYYSVGGVILGAVAGFGLHFVTMAFSPRIGQVLERLFD
jgi:hypothetical protein